jgi:hypothetical protein
MQQMPLLQAASPMHRSLHTLTDDRHAIGASQAEPPSQRMSQLDAVHSMPPPHVLASRQESVHLEPAHRILPPQLEGARHSIVDVLAVVASTPP